MGTSMVSLTPPRVRRKTHLGTLHFETHEAWEAISLSLMIRHRIRTMDSSSLPRSGELVCSRPHPARAPLCSRGAEAADAGRHILC